MKMIMSGDTDKAFVLASDILKIYPQSATAWMIRSVAMQEKDDMQEALAAAQRAVDAAPDNADAHFSLGLILSKLGQFYKAVTEYEQMFNLAEQAGDLNNYKRAQMLDVLATAYADAGRFPEAIATAEKALESALSSGRQEVAEHIRKRLESFKAKSTGQQP